MKVILYNKNINKQYIAMVIHFQNVLKKIKMGFKTIFFKLLGYNSEKLSKEKK